MVCTLPVSYTRHVINRWWLLVSSFPTSVFIRSSLSLIGIVECHHLKKIGAVVPPFEGVNELSCTPRIKTVSQILLFIIHKSLSPARLKINALALVHYKLNYKCSKLARISIYKSVCIPLGLECRVKLAAIFCKSHCSRVFNDYKYCLHSF